MSTVTEVSTTQWLESHEGVYWSRNTHELVSHHALIEDYDLDPYVYLSEEFPELVLQAEIDGAGIEGSWTYKPSAEPPEGHPAIPWNPHCECGCEGPTGPRHVVYKYPNEEWIR